MEQFRGTGVALVTPFTESGAIDFPALERIVEYTIQGGVDYLVVLGTTGESVTLTKEEKQQVAQKVSTVNAGRLPLVLGIGGNNTSAVAQQLRETDLSEYNGVLSVSPSYNKPTQEGIYQHFKALSKVSSKPIIMYNVPSRTGSNMLPETTVRLAEDFENIIGIKEACGNSIQIDAILQTKPEDFLVISGDDFTALPTVLAGGAGVISVLGQGLPQEFSQMIQLGLQSQPKEAFQIHHQLMPLMHMIFEEGNPAGIKSIFEHLALSTASVRLPLVEASNQLKGKITSYLKSLNQVSA
ncbi:4-hydroxy-tetrahydrodipicolinate synthase [Flagellimonas meridianipacifica]|uniref:4-hydroxy-tetrahydrodipicolinate synthase n=1 Tax=Flagellimonas meridianipacifica TaxID=1080225 RepID=A0A2T0MAF2_9FLAO|nr:4-hydroxy-tetrahydrodipicolinate synthase [Allomuricauda pacifica]PRX54506.1 4-hydroxy-tetrahydrodipicolinate synthase [Allomuricauda pacifica]